MNAIDATANLAPLWERLRASFARATAVTGAAARIAVCAAPALRREIHGWVALLEHLVRKLLFAEAGRLAQSGPRTSSSAWLPTSRTGADKSAPSPRSESVDDRSTSDAANPESWAVRFSLAPPRDPRAVPEARAPRIRALWGPTPPPPPRVPERTGARRDSSLQLARRFEALRRVLVDPAPHVRRLAELMRRLVLRHPEAPLQFVLSGARTNHFDREDPRLGVACVGAALDSLPAFNSS